MISAVKENNWISQFSFGPRFAELKESSSYGKTKSTVKKNNPIFCLPHSLSLCLSLLLLRLRVAQYLSPLLLLFLCFTLLLLHLLLLSLSLSQLETLDSKERFSWDCRGWIGAALASLTRRRLWRIWRGRKRRVLEHHPLLLKRKSGDPAWTTQLSRLYRSTRRSSALLFLPPSLNFTFQFHSSSTQTQIPPPSKLFALIFIKRGQF